MFTGKSSPPFSSTAHKAFFFSVEIVFIIIRCMVKSSGTVTGVMGKVSGYFCSCPAQIPHGEWYVARHDLRVQGRSGRWPAWHRCRA